MCQLKYNPNLDYHLPSIIAYLMKLISHEIDFFGEIFSVKIRWFKNQFSSSVVWSSMYHYQFSSSSWVKIDHCVSLYELDYFLLVYFTPGWTEVEHCSRATRWRKVQLVCGRVRGSNFWNSLSNSHISKSLFFVQKFNFDFPRKL